MAIASNVPFKLQVIKKFPKEIIQEGTLFSTDEKEVWEKEIITLSIEENDEIEIYLILMMRLLDYIWMH